MSEGPPLLESDKNIFRISDKVVYYIDLYIKSDLNFVLYA